MGHILIMSVEHPGDRNPDHSSRASAGWHPPHPPTPWPQHKPQAEQFHSSFATLWPCAGPTRLCWAVGSQCGQRLWQLTSLKYQGMIDRDSLESHTKCHPVFSLPSTSRSPFTWLLQWDVVVFAGKWTKLKVKERAWCRTSWSPVCICCTVVGLCTRDAS